MEEINMEAVNGSEPVGEKPQKVRDPVTGHLVFDSPVHQRAREYYWEHKRKEQENFDHLYGEYPTVGKQGANVEMQEWKPSQVAEYYGVSTSTIYTWIRDGVLEAEERLALSGNTDRKFYIIYNRELLRVSELAHSPALEPYMRKVFPRAVARALSLRKAKEV